MTPLTNQKLVEALEAISRRAPIMGSKGDYRAGQLDALEACREVAQNALKEASAPMKEFPPGSGMDKKEWQQVYEVLYGLDTKWADACRQIAESLQ